MTEHTGERVGPEGERETSEEDVSRLLRLAGRRAGVPDLASARVRRAAHTQWRAVVQARRRRSFVRGSLLVAAGVLLALGIGLRPAPGTPIVPSATRLVGVRVERTRGAALRATTAGGAALALKEGADLVAGAWLETAADGRAALRASGRVSLRLDTGTRVQVLSASSFRLERGGLYVDTGAGPSPRSEPGSAASLSVRTAHALLRDIGTQFEVRADEGLTTVHVRDGVVALDGRGESTQALAGTALRADRDGGVVESRVPIYGPAWAWVEEIAPDFALEGQSLRAFLDWAAHETGWTLRFSSDSLAQSAGSVWLHGSTTGLTPSQALEAVLPTCGFQLRRDAGTGWIEPASSTRGAK